MATRELLVDTSIVIDHLRKQNKSSTTLVKAAATHTLYISTIVEFELFAGALDTQKQNDLHVILERCTVVPFTSEIAQNAAKIYQQLRQQNQLIEMRDIFIGATAIVYNLPLLTINSKHFIRIERLKIAPLP